MIYPRNPLVNLHKQVLGSFMVVLILLLTSLAGAAVKLPALISDDMVIQRGMDVPIWGTALPGEQVSVTLGDQQLTTAADSEGKWIVKLNTLEAGGPFDMTVAGNNTITLSNVLVGEVWVCSGQSNMQWPVNRALDAEQEIVDSEYPMIRLYTVKRVVAAQPLEDTEGSWVACGPETVGSFSAVGYFFGRDLHKTLSVPVGLINSSWSGTPAEAWTSLPTLEADPTFKPIFDRWDQIIADYPRAEQGYREKLAQWEQEVQKAMDEGRPAPRKPVPPRGPNHPHRPACLYNGMIAPLIPYAIKGVIWYQGESNAGRAYQYRKLFPKMIYDWRRSWGQGDFPFLFVQLANFMGAPPPPAESAWAELREAQLMTLLLPKTGMAAAIDIGESYNIHPKNKQDVGSRLALAAKAIAYDKDIVYSGPIYESITIEGSKIRIHFGYVGEGLMTKDDDPVKGFAIAGQNCKFVWAQAEIEGDTVVVWNNRVLNPIAVRYAWGDDPECNLYNKAGLPASPFRTDHWPGITAGEQIVK